MPQETNMLEATTNEAIRTAIRKAHEERAQASRDFWGWMFGTSSR